MKLLKTEIQCARFPKPQSLHYLHEFLRQPAFLLDSHLFHIPHDMAAAPLPMNYLKWQGSSVQGQWGYSVCPHHHQLPSFPSAQLLLPIYSLLADSGFASPPLSWDATLLGSSEGLLGAGMWLGPCQIRKLWKQMCSR